MSRASNAIVLKLVRVGNSRGVRLPKGLIDKYAIKDSLIAEEREDGLLLRASQDKRLSWAETFKEMAHEDEDWSDLDATVGDGLKPNDWPQPKRRRKAR
jgi:antitoxin MazE